MFLISFNLLRGVFTDILRKKVAMFQHSKLQQTGRKIQICGWALVGSIAWGMLAWPSVAQVPSAPVNNQGRQLNLHDQLVYGLKAFTKSDFNFIDRVVLKVKQGKLPKRLVNATFLWSRERAARRSRSRELRPMVYFRPALTIQSKKIGVRL